MTEQAVTGYPYFAAGRDSDNKVSDEMLAMEHPAWTAWFSAIDKLNEWLRGRAAGTAPIELPRDIQTALERMGIELENQYATVEEPPEPLGVYYEMAAGQTHLVHRDPCVCTKHIPSGAILDYDCGR